MNRCLLLTALALADAAGAQSPAAGSADGRLRALYTAEWTWRQQEMARRSDAPGDAGAADHFPKVDAASQQRLDARVRLRHDADLEPVVAHEP